MISGSNNKVMMMVMKINHPKNMRVNVEIKNSIWLGITINQINTQILKKKLRKHKSHGGINDERSVND